MGEYNRPFPRRCQPWASYVLLTRMHRVNTEEASSACTERAMRPCGERAMQCCVDGKGARLEQT